jgi:hypothetical protein
MELKLLPDIPPWDWPPDAAETIYQALTDKSASGTERLIAAELAGDLVVMNDSMAGALLAIVGDAEEREELRAAAAIGLGPVLEECDIADFEDPSGYNESPIAELTLTCPQ